MNMTPEDSAFVFTKGDIGQLVTNLSQQVVALGCQNIEASVKSAIGELTRESMQIPARNDEVVNILRSVRAQYLAFKSEENLSRDKERNKTQLQILKRFLELFYLKFKASGKRLIVSEDGFDQELNQWLQSKKCYFTRQIV